MAPWCLILQEFQRLSNHYTVVKDRKLYKGKAIHTSTMAAADISRVVKQLIEGMQAAQEGKIGADAVIGLLYDSGNTLTSVANELVAQQAQTDPLVAAVVKKGVANFDWNGLPQQQRADLLTRVADVYIMLADYNNTLEAYGRANLPIPNDKLVQLGDNCASRLKFEQAIDCYQRANDRDKLVALGDSILKHPTRRQDYLRFAREAFRIADERAKLIEVAQAYIAKNCPTPARECYELAGQPAMAELLRAL